MLLFVFWFFVSQCSYETILIWYLSHYFFSKVLIINLSFFKEKKIKKRRKIDLKNKEKKEKNKEKIKRKKNNKKQKNKEEN